MKSLKQISLQTKILTYVLGLLVIIILLLTTIYFSLERKQTEKYVGELALNSARAIASIPQLVEAFEENNPSETIQPLVEKIRKEIEAEFIVVGNVENIRYSHPDPRKIGYEMVGGDNELALLFGESYISKAEGSLGVSLRGKTPVFNDEGEIIGVVSVGFMLEYINSIFYEDLKLFANWSFFVFLIGTVGSVLLARNIRDETFGLEPYQIAALYRERSAILESVKEGIIAVDDQEIVTMINQSAKHMLNLTGEVIGKPIGELYPITKMNRVLQSGEDEGDQEILLRNRIVIVNRTPIHEKGKIVGVVASFRDRTELQNMINTLSEVKQYSQGLRAQTHEFTNKLYAISGLLQIGNIKEAVELIHSETKNHQIQNKILFEQINDPTFQAVLLGKISKASEKKIYFSIDEESTLESIQAKENMSNIISILGNLIDNAFDAVMQQKEKKVTFFVTDVGHDIVIEVADNGLGIDETIVKKMFEKGFTTKKGSNRGFGLSLVKESIHDMKGTIEVQHNQPKGAIFTVFIPKKEGK